MIGDALPLECERAQPQRTRRRRRVADRLQRLCVGPRIGDRAVARDPARQPVPAEGGHRLESLLDSLVHEAETLLEAQHLFADDLEAEMSRLDDSRVDRPDGDLVHAVAFDTDEGVFLLSGLPLRQRLEIAAERVAVDGPARLPRPRPLIIAFRRDADEIERRALHPVGGGEHDRQVGVRRSAGRQRVLEHDEAVGILHHDAERIAALAVAIVACPQRDQVRALLPCDATGRQQSHRIDRAPPRGHRRGQRGGGESESGEIHGNQPMSRAACRYQSARNGGIQSPSISTSARWV